MVWDCARLGRPATLTPLPVSGVRSQPRSSKLDSSRNMGSLCSKPGTHTGGHTVLGSGTEQSPTQPLPQHESPEQRRERLARAAKERQQKDLERLTNKKNPNAGKLASQVNKPVKQPTQDRRDEQLVWD
ncbi:uncharacterized protein FOMMEDRAFT_155034 [Fomitiporia mediterranea MF3/22]|uniref:uncharacterized protein n=1 Tax=Fomitiporia mediterranea (strain MF3/22) TaxID=694068 RepID=UPI0004407448|nr:uncharacterized protein FOMMEDRAFT_155034 [Fomitiporia mediterranea MF3/22]EJD03911.1 hypothetical protein FOMMEDRAFT_155034 [Fomitiporia mediterranea MF3/22]